MPTFTPVRLEALPGWARDLLAEARVARLGYVDEDDHPRVLPVTFAVAAGAVVTAIDEKPKRSAEPARLRQLRRRPEAALLVDLYDDDWTRLAWVQLLGRKPAARPLTPRAGVEARRLEAGHLSREQEHACGYAGAAVGHQLAAGLGAGGPEARAQLL